MNFLTDQVGWLAPLDLGLDLGWNQRGESEQDFWLNQRGSVKTKGVD